VAERSVNQPGLPTDYYAPDYRIEIEGQELDPKSKGVCWVVVWLAVDKESFTVSLIPTTLGLTTLGEKGPGSMVNLEVDVIAKYVEKLTAGGTQ